MKVQVLGESVGATGAGSSVDMSTTPFMDRHSVAGCIDVSPNFDGTYSIQTSDDGSSWTTVMTVTGANQPNKKAEIALKRYVRGNMTAYTAGAASGYLLG